MILDRKDAADETAYTAYLFREGLDKILKEVGEACSLLLVPQRAATGRGLPTEMAQPDLSSDEVMMVCKEIPAEAAGRGVGSPQWQDRQSEAVPPDEPEYEKRTPNGPKYFHCGPFLFFAIEIPFTYRGRKYPVSHSLGGSLSNLGFAVRFRRDSPSIHGCSPASRLGRCAVGIR